MLSSKRFPGTNIDNCNNADDDANNDDGDDNDGILTVLPAKGFPGTQSHVAGVHSGQLGTTFIAALCTYTLLTYMNIC